MQSLETYQPKPEAMLDTYYSNWKFMVSVAQRKGLDLQTAEDIAQEGALKVFKSSQRYNSELAPQKSWGALIVANTAIDELRRRNSRVKETTIYGSDQDIDGMVVQPVEEKTVEGVVTQNDEAQHIHELVDTLPENQKMAIKISFFQEISNSQGAEIMGIPLGTFKSYVRLGKETLKKLLEQEDLVAA